MLRSWIIKLLKHSRGCIVFLTSRNLSFSPNCSALQGERTMEFLLPILLGLLASLIGGLYLLGAFRQRCLGEPPLDKGPIPWLGHVLEFRRDTARFLERMKQKHGDIFTVQLKGFYVTFIMDPFSFGAVVKEAPTKLDFRKFLRQLVAKAFDYKAIVIDNRIHQLFNHKHLMGDELVAITESMINNLQNLMLHSVGSGEDQKTWIEAGLFMYSYNIAFRAGYLAVFGNENAKTAGSVEKAKETDRIESEALFHEFRKYDLLYPSLVNGVLPPWEKMEVERLKRHFWNTLSVQKLKTKDNISGWVWDIQQAKEYNGMKEFMLNRYMFMILWASQSNTGSASFWLLLYLMKHPEAMRAVKGEIDEVLKETGQEARGDGPLINLTRDMLLKTPILDSAVEETLRLTSAPLLTRAVLQDFTLKMADGHEYRIREGDRVALFPYKAVQIDPEVHPDPLSFKYDRFLNPEGGKKTHFYKAGKKLKYFNMPWGAGLSMCPGRFLATNEVKQFVFLMLIYFDFELKNPDEKIPDTDVNRLGFGVLQPIRDIQFRYRLRF